MGKFAGKAVLNPSAFEYGRGLGIAMDSATERGLEDGMPREVIGTKGMQSKQFRKKFKNAQEMDRWMDANGDDVEITHVQRV